MFFQRKEITLIILVIISFSCKNPGRGNTGILQAVSDTASARDTLTRNLLYGIPADSFDQIAGHIRPNVFLSDILLKHGVSMSEIDQVLKNSRQVFDVRTIRSGNNYILFCDRDSIARAKYLLYEHDPTTCLCFQL